MEIAILIFRRLTALDAVGPYEVLSKLPEAKVRWVAVEPGPKRADAGLALVADHTLEQVAHPDVVVVPGGFGTRTVMRDPRVLDWVRSAHATSTWTTSVCTGSLVLAAAGVLRGLEATTHWNSLEMLGELGARPLSERIVRRGKVITAAGVSAGIDMGLHLAQQIAGDAMAQAIQLGIEYDPEPPFDAGSPGKAPKEIVELVRSAFAQREAEG
jgi:transcriptional regulator GlxA family with amidase domain